MRACFEYTNEWSTSLSHLLHSWGNQLPGTQSASCRGAALLPGPFPPGGILVPGGTSKKVRVYSPFYTGPRSQLWGDLAISTKPDSPTWQRWG